MPMRPTQDYASCYEKLRGYALQRQLLADRLGLAVLRLQGLAAWMTQWSELPVPTPTPATEIAWPSPLPNSAHADVVNVLAAMALCHLQETHA
jgi:hypothetical protein